MRSKFEERFAADLTKRGVAFEYEPLSFTYLIPRKYTPDFVVKSNRVNPRKRPPLLLETKGYLTPADRTKMLAVIAQHPGIDLRIVFQNASNKLYKGSKTTYGEWATKNGIPWAEKVAPKSWFD